MNSFQIQIFRRLGRRALGIAATVAVVAVVAPAQAEQESAFEEILGIMQRSNMVDEEGAARIRAKYAAEQEARDPEVSEGKRPKNALVPYWKGGLRLDSADQNFKLKIGGRILGDWTTYETDKDIRDDVNGGTSIGDGTEFRQARIMLSGQIHGNLGYKTQLDFAGQDADFKDVFVELRKIPHFGNLRVGHYKEPFSLEQANSRKHFTFMERGLPNAFSPERNTGFMIRNTILEDRALWAVGVFRDAGDSGNSFGPESDYNVTARFSGLPWYEEEGRKLLHLGLSYSHQFRDGRAIRYHARPEAHLGPRFVDTGTFDAEGVDLINPELGLQYGPASMQFEWVSALVDRAGQGNNHFHGFYVQGAYFLTGEHRSYKQTNGSFDSITPNRNFDMNGGWGAWQLAARYSTLDLNDDDVRGGELGNLTLAVNWYLNPNFRWTLNYVRADLKGSGEANIFQSRFMIFF